MDVAASEFYTEDKMYDLDFKTADNDGSQKKTAAQMQDMYKSFVENYPVVSIEDPFDQVRRFRVSSPPAGVKLNRVLFSLKYGVLRHGCFCCVAVFSLATVW